MASSSSGRQKRIRKWWGLAAAPHPGQRRRRSRRAYAVCVDTAAAEAMRREAAVLRGTLGSVACAWLRCGRWGHEAMRRAVLLAVRRCTACAYVAMLRVCGAAAALMQRARRSVSVPRRVLQLASCTAEQVVLHIHRCSLLRLLESTVHAYSGQAVQQRDWARILRPNDCKPVCSLQAWANCLSTLPVVAGRCITSLCDTFNRRVFSVSNAQLAIASLGLAEQLIRGQISGRPIARCMTAGHCQFKPALAPGSHANSAFTGRSQRQHPQAAL